MRLPAVDDKASAPLISSVSRRRFSSRGDGPITIGKIFAAACAQLDASVTEQPAFPAAVCAGLSASFFAGAICACRHRLKNESPGSKERTKIVLRRIVTGYV